MREKYVTQEMLSDPNFRAKMYDAVFDVGSVLIAQHDKAQPACTAGNGMPEHKAPPSC